MQFRLRTAYKQHDLNEKQFLIEAILKAEYWEAHCDVLTKVEINTSNKAIYSSPKPFVNIDPLWARVSSLSPTRII